MGGVILLILSRGDPPRNDWQKETSWPTVLLGGRGTFQGSLHRGLKSAFLYFFWIWFRYHQVVSFPGNANIYITCFFWRGCASQMIVVAWCHYSHHIQDSELHSAGQVIMIKHDKATSLSLLRWVCQGGISWRRWRNCPYEVLQDFTPVIFCASPTENYTHKD